MSPSEEIICLLQRYLAVEDFEMTLVGEVAPEGQERMRQLLCRSAAWQKNRTEIERELNSGGELWQWESKGMRCFAGIGGLVIIREGICAKSWVLFKS